MDKYACKYIHLYEKNAFEGWDVFHSILNDYVFIFS